MIVSRYESGGGGGMGNIGKWEMEMCRGEGVVFCKGYGNKNRKKTTHQNCSSQPH